MIEQVAHHCAGNHDSGAPSDGLHKSKCNQRFDVRRQCAANRSGNVQHQPGIQRTFTSEAIRQRDERVDRDGPGGGDREEREEDDDEPRLENGTAKSDVFLVEGQQLRYGSKTAWQVATR